jgi:hypothetical protein
VSWQFGVDVSAAGTSLSNSVIGAEDGAAKDLIDIEVDRSIAMEREVGRYRTGLKWGQPLIVTGSGERSLNSVCDS